LQSGKRMSVLDHFGKLDREPKAPEGRFLRAVAFRGAAVGSRFRARAVASMPSLLRKQRCLLAPHGPEAERKFAARIRIEGADRGTGAAGDAVWREVAGGDGGRSCSRAFAPRGRRRRGGLPVSDARHVRGRRCFIWRSQRPSIGRGGCMRPSAHAARDGEVEATRQQLHRDRFSWRSGYLTLRDRCADMRPWHTKS
jgi:hypothetical protein